MTSRNDYSIFLDKLLAKNRFFAAWSMPGELSPSLIICEEKDIFKIQEYQKLDGMEGFVFAPFRINNETPLFLMKPGILLKNHDDISSFDIEALPFSEKKIKTQASHFFISREEYLNDIERTVAEIKKTRLAKVIVSRLISRERGRESLGRLYMGLREKAPNGFVYLVNLPEAGTWMGATPEVLLQSHGKTMETVSLAGTQAKRNDGNYSWFTKEIEEQAFVSRYMLDIFYRFGIYPYTTQGPETLESGNVAHLKTSFHFSSKKIDGKLGEFVNELHPTPAVCGLPKNKADQFIRKIEKHDRRYYTGYMGPWSPGNSVRLFVNLRCMEITPGEYILYSGGGITSRSVPEEEWEETNNKAKTLLSAIEAVRIE